MFIAATLGTVGQWATVLAVVALGWFLWRGQAGAAVAILSDSNRVLERKVEDLTKELAEARRMIATLQAKTDVTVALAPILDSLADHERHAGERSDKLLRVLDLIAKHLGPESGDKP